MFERLGRARSVKPGLHRIGKGVLLYRGENPAKLAEDPRGDVTLVKAVQEILRGTRVQWRETSHLQLRRGPYLIAAGLDESIDAPPRAVRGQFIDLFDPELRLQTGVALEPGRRILLLDLAQVPAGPPRVLAGACKTFQATNEPNQFRFFIEGIAKTPGIVLLRVPGAPQSAALNDEPLELSRYDAGASLLWLQFTNLARPRESRVRF